VFISRLRASGMPIGTLSHYLALVLEGDHTAPQRLALMQEHRAKITGSCVSCSSPSR